MENENQTAETMTETPAEETQTSVDYDAGWDDATPAETETEDASKQDESEPDAGKVEETKESSDNTDAQNQNPGTETAADDGAKPEANQPKAEEKPQAIHVKYMDEEKDLTAAEAAELAQKGMDYDRVRKKYDENKPVVELMKSLAERSGMNLPDFAQYIRMQTKQAEGLDEQAAKSAIALEDREAAVSAKEAEQQEREKAQKDTDQQENRVHEEIQKFIDKYPDVKPESVPQEVWQKMTQGENLVESYQDYLLTKAKAEAGAAKQAAENSKASPGSMRSAGNPKSEKDPMEAGWDT